MSWNIVRDKVNAQADIRLAEKTESFAKMQGLSSRAHAFSVEALVGKPCKRMKVSEGHESSSAGDAGSDTSIFTGPSEYPVSQMKKAGSTPRRAEDTSCDPERQTVRSRAEEAEASGEEDKPKESDCRPDREVRVELQGSELWKRFYEIGTEMIITKAGRRMFPSVRVKVRNLDPCQQYYVAMDVMPVDSKRYRYVYHSSQWMVAGNTDHSCISPRLYVHPDSPCAGETWMRQVISFDRVKLTNNEMDDKGHIILQSMHKYKPRVHIIRHDPRMDLSQIQSLPAEGVHSFSFPETEFTTVTAYQNQQITKLKIDRNPFAKGFRDPGRNRYRKPHQTPTLVLAQRVLRSRTQEGFKGSVGWLVGVISLERPSQLRLQAIHLTAPRELRVADRQREESPPSLLSFIPSPVLRALLPGRHPPHPRSSSLQQGFHHLTHLPAAQQSLLLPGSRQTERPAPAGSANRPPAPLGAAGKETSPL